MRFVVFRSRNTDPNTPAAWLDQPMAMTVPEDDVCSRDEELYRCEGLVCLQWWDPKYEN